jgi:hypothetical protein
MLKGIAVVIVLALAGVLIFAATKPDIFRVQRSTTMQAPPEKIFPFINDFQRWSVWSPYEKLDPAMKRSYSGPASGVGAVYAWEGNSDAGIGSIEITEVVAPTRIAMNLDFVKPFEAHNQVEFTLVPRGDTTEVTWAMRGPTPYMAKVMHVFIDMDGMVGKDFEAGLASLKAAAER